MYVHVCVYMYVYVCVHTQTHMSASAFRSQKQKLDPLELEIRVDTSHQLWVPGAEVGSSARGKIAFNPWTIFPTVGLIF